jgi:hypothetical protein
VALAYLLAKGLRHQRATVLARREGLDRWLVPENLLVNGPGRFGFLAGRKRAAQSQLARAFERVGREL